MVKHKFPRAHKKCPCGTKRKYRNCCGKKTQTIPFGELPEETQDMFKELAIKRDIEEKFHSQYFGCSPPIISCVFKGRRLVAVGNRFLSCDNPKVDWEDPLDFFVCYLKTLLGNDWFFEEIEKPTAEQNEVIRWYSGINFKVGEINCSNKQVLNGRALALLHLAYDLFVLDSTNNLPSRLVDRIKNKQNFNGARYEVFVFATLIRAGFKIEFQDETSGVNGKVVECRVSHFQFEEYISVEAKTRNVKGVLGSTQGNKNKIKLYDKLKNSIDKKVKEPYIIFVDMNLLGLDVFKDKEKMEKIRCDVDKLQKNNPNSLPNLICVTNIPFHYGKDGGLPGESVFGFFVIHNPKFLLKNERSIIDAIMCSTKKYNFLPRKFEESKKFADSVCRQLGDIRS